MFLSPNGIYLLILLLCGLYTSFSDFYSRKISNNVVVIIAVFSLLLCVNQQSYFSLVTAGLLLAAGFLLNLLGVWGAGDAKLIAAYAIGIKPEWQLLSLSLIGFLGGIIACVYWIYGRFSCLGNDKGIPYGIPICIGSLFGILVSIESVSL